MRIIYLSDQLFTAPDGEGMAEFTTFIVCD